MKEDKATGAPVVRFTRGEVDGSWPGIRRALTASAEPRSPVAMALQLADSYLSLCDVVWPGREPWKPTAEQPQQDFYEGVVESFRLQHQIDEKEIMALRGDTERMHDALMSLADEPGQHCCDTDDSGKLLMQRTCTCWRARAREAAGVTQEATRGA